MANRRAFSLLEILLVLTLILVLLAALISTPNPQAELDNGTINFVTLLHFCKANAANTGKPIKLVINNDISVLWSADPLQNPGVFQTFPALDGLVESVNSLVDIKSKNPTIWNADGSSNPNKFCISSKNPEDQRKIVVEIKESGKIKILWR